MAFEPWALNLTIEGLRGADASGSTDQFTLQRHFIAVELQSLVRLAPVIDTITIEQPRLSLRHLGGGRCDLDDMLQRLARPARAELDDPPRFALYNIRVSDGEITLSMSRLS